MAEILKPETNIPYELAMKFDSPKIVDSQLTGDKQAMITLVDGRIVYAPAFVADRLGEMGIRRDMPFILCRREVRTEKGKALRWEVKPIDTAKPEVPAPAAPARAEAPASPSPAKSQSCADLNQHAQATITPLSAKLCSTMCALIDSMREAKAYAQRAGIDLTNEDLRCLVNTAYIQASREGGAR